MSLGTCAAIELADRPVNNAAMKKSQTSRDEAAAWVRFWDGRERGTEHRYRDPRVAVVLRQHWQHCLSERFEGAPVVSLVDIACGEGELLRIAADCASGAGVDEFEACCTDISRNAVALAADAMPEEALAIPAVANAAELPFADAVFDCAISQYGLEYAGPEAFSEAARVVGETGSLHALVHCQGGVVEAACEEVAALLSAVVDGRLLGRLAEYVEAMVPAGDGAISDETVRDRVEQLRHGFDAVDEAVRAAKPGPARDHVARLVVDSRTLASRLGHYALADVSAWIGGQKLEIEAFLHRMTSMLDVAQSEDDMRAVVGRLEAAGLRVEALSVLEAPGQGGALAWVVDARRSDAC